MCWWFTKLLYDGSSASETERIDESEAVTVARFGDWKRVMGSLSEEQLVRCTDPEGNTLLHIAASSNNLEVLEKLLSIPTIRVDAVDKQGHTALGFAAANGHVDSVSQLLFAGADPNKKDVHGHSPIWAAKDRGHENVLGLFLKSAT